jgi:hypothetical protein
VSLWAKIRLLLFIRILINTDFRCVQHKRFILDKTIWRDSWESGALIRDIYLKRKQLANEQELQNW